MALFGKSKTKDKKPKEQAEASDATSFVKTTKVKKDLAAKVAAKDRVEEKVETEIPAGAALPKGGDAHSYEIVLSPHITEKGTLLGEHNKYVFKVPAAANKLDIKKAVENLYKVEVAKVRTSYLPSKYRRVGRFEGSKSGFKKTTVTLKEGSKIDLAA